MGWAHAVFVEVQAPGQDDHLGNLQGWSPLKDDVGCLITQGAGGRVTRFGQQPLRRTYTVTGSDSVLGRQDIRVTPKPGSPAAGVPMRVLDSSDHGTTPAGDTWFYRLSVERFSTATNDEAGTADGDGDAGGD